METKVNFKLLRASDLPKTDRFSLIDPYFKIRGTGNETPVKENNANPEWNLDFQVVVLYHPETRTMDNLVFELWDKNTTLFSKDELVGTATLDFAKHFYTRGDTIKLDIITQHKHHSPTLEIVLGEIFFTPGALEKVLAPIIPGIQMNGEGYGRLYIPLSIGPVYLGLEYERDKVDIKLYITAPIDNLYLDMVIVYEEEKIRRRKFPGRTHIYGSVYAYEEIKLNNARFSSICAPGRMKFFMFKKEVVDSIALDQIVIAHGWDGVMNFKTAAKKLKEVQVDYEKQAIYFRREDSFIVLDFDEDDIDFKCLILDTPKNSTVAYDWTLKSGEGKKTTEIFIPPKVLPFKKCRDTNVQRQLELEDTPYGTWFEDLIWTQYRVTEPISVSLSDIITLIPSVAINPNGTLVFSLHSNNIGIPEE